MVGSIFVNFYHFIDPQSWLDDHIFNTFCSMPTYFPNLMFMHSLITISGVTLLFDFGD